MAEALAMKYDKTNKDPDKDRRGCWKEGMVVVVKEDGWKWSETELNSYKIVYMPELPEEKLAKWLKIEYDTTSGNWEKEGDEVYRRRRYVIDLDSLTPTDEMALENMFASDDARLAVLDARTIDMKSVAIGP